MQRKPTLGEFDGTGKHLVRGLRAVCLERFQPASQIARHKTGLGTDVLVFWSQLIGSGCPRCVAGKVEDACIPTCRVKEQEANTTDATHVGFYDI